MTIALRMRKSPQVSIIIATLASADRSEQLQRAIGSALSSAANGRVKVLVCVNGSRWDAETVSMIQRNPIVTVHHLAEASLPKALATGRCAVETEFFGFLDDDDELLPGSIDARLAVLRANPGYDLVATNGIRRTCNGEEPMFKHLATVPADPLVALFNENWLASCGALFRSTSVSRAYFDDYHDYAEWTWLAYCLCLNKRRVAVVDEPMFIVNETIGSRSKSIAYQNSYLALYLRMLTNPLPPNIFRIVRGRLASALHDSSVDSLSRGEIWSATKLHLRSLALPGGLRFASYSRHIALAAISAGRRRRD